MPTPLSPSAAPTDPAVARVRTEGDRRWLEFTPGLIQSEMRLSQPDRLVLRYARAMMGFVLFQPRPRHIVMVGLGGGSLLKFCHRHLPGCRITVLESRADVIALREQFLIPPDDARLRVVRADAVAFLAAAAPDEADVILLDGFDAAGAPPALGSALFYDDCRRVLRPGGVLVTNMLCYDARYRAMLARLGRAYGGRLCQLDGVAGNNRIVFALKPARADGDGRATPGRPGPGRAELMRRLIVWRRPLGLHWLNRLLIDWMICRLAHRRA